MTRRIGRAHVYCSAGAAAGARRLHAPACTYLHTRICDMLDVPTLATCAMPVPTGAVAKGAACRKAAPPPDPQPPYAVCRPPATSPLLAWPVHERTAAQPIPPPQQPPPPPSSMQPCTPYPPAPPHPPPAPPCQGPAQPAWAPWGRTRPPRTPPGRASQPAGRTAPRPRARRTAAAALCGTCWPAGHRLQAGRAWDSAARGSAAQGSAGWAGAGGKQWPLEW